jgi:hypothetical protein
MKPVEVSVEILLETTPGISDGFAEKRTMLPS